LHLLSGMIDFCLLCCAGIEVGRRRPTADPLAAEG
jgi:hypothetical protein